MSAIDPQEIEMLIAGDETFRVECTRSTTDKDKFRETICAFSNDLPGAKEPGYLIIGVDEKDPSFRLEITDELQQQFASYRQDAQILPQPKLSVHPTPHPDGDGQILVVKVLPHDIPPVRYRGRTCVRVGPRKDYATPEEERLLMERRSVNFRTFDVTPCPESDISRLDLVFFTGSYRPQAIDREVIAENGRILEEQLAALRFYSLKRDCPTNAGVLALAFDPLDLFPGAVIQFTQFGGPELDAQILVEKRFTGNLPAALRELDAFIAGRFTRQPIPETDLKERLLWDYPPDCIRELLMNAVLHRNYQSNAPIRFYQFSDRIEIQNPGGLYGDVTPENFPKANDYRNPVLAEVMHNLGYANRFGRGIAKAKSALKENGSPEASFEFHPNFFLVKIFKHPSR